MTIRYLMASAFRLALILPALTPSWAQDHLPEKGVAVPEKEMAKRLDHMEAPKLPAGALKQKCSNALVMLKVNIDANVHVSDATFVGGFDELRESTLTAVKLWTYKPYEKNGHAVAVQTQLSIFYLGDGEAFPMYSPDGNGGVKGGNMLPLPPGCGHNIEIKRYDK